MSRGPSHRWVVLAGAVCVQVVIGGVYAWSVFGKALQHPDALGLSKIAASVPFEVAVGMIVVGTFVGGRLQDRHGPRPVALAGIATYATGILLSSLATTPERFWVLVAGYGVLGGFGLGLAYIVPLAMLQKWFPDRPALATGLAVAGFGFGSVLTSPIAQALIEAAPTRPASAFGPLGLAYLAIGLAGASVFANPDAATAAPATTGLTPREALATPAWWTLTATLALSVFAGISLISVAAASMVDIAGLSPGAAAVAVGVLGLGNGAGRVGWAWASERLGRRRALAAVLGLQGVALLALPYARTPASFLTLAAIVYACYGGAFGVLPSTAGRFFGVAHAGAIYGLMLVGWSLGGVAGPLLASALIGPGRDYPLAFGVVGAVALGAVALPLLTRPPQHGRDGRRPSLPATLSGPGR